MSKARENMRESAFRAILSAAFFSVESAVIIALSIMLFGFGFQPFDWWQPWFWLVFGALAEALYMVAAVTDPDAAADAVDRMLTRRFDLDAIQNPQTRDRLKRALEYERLIREAAQRQGGSMRSHIQDTAGEIGDWVEQIYNLAQRMDQYDANPVVRRDRRMAPYDLRTLRSRLEDETDPAVRAELEEAIQAKEAQIANLRSLENNIKRADIQLDHTLSSLGTVYAQVQLIDTKQVDSARTKRLHEEIRDEILSLEDTISAIDEVQSYQRYSVEQHASHSN